MGSDVTVCTGKEYVNRMKERNERLGEGLLRRLAVGGLSVAVTVSSLGAGMAVPVYAAENEAVYQDTEQPDAGQSNEQQAEEQSGAGQTVTEQSGTGESEGTPAEEGQNGQPGAGTADSTAADESGEGSEGNSQTISGKAQEDGQNGTELQSEQNSELQTLDAGAQETTVEVSTPLLITEIVADTHQADQETATGTDAFEYVEIYNSSDQTVSMDDYLIQNINGSTVTDWEIPAGTELEAGKSLVVWIRNSESDDLSEEDFRSYYGISDDADVQIVMTTESVNGFSNSGERSIRLIVRTTEQTITQITYNDGEQKAQTKKGINFGYTEGQVQQPTLSYDENPTPGSLVAVTAASQVIAGENFEISAATNLTGLITEAYVQIGNEQYTMTENTGTFTVSVPATAYEGQDSFIFQVHMTDGVNTLTSEQKSVTVNQQASDAKLPAPLLVTEIVPNTENIGDSDGYEFFEIYNAGSQAVNLDQYSFWYDNGSSVTEWSLEDEGLVLDAGKSLVVWIKNEANIAAGTTVEDFNGEYGTSFTEGENLTTVQSDGFSNSGSRSLSLRTRTGLSLYTVTYTAGESSDGSLGENEAISFNYNGSEITTRYDGTVTPGQLDAEQAIVGQYTFPEKAGSPSVTAEAPSQVNAGEDWTVQVTDTNLTGTILSAELRIYAGEGTDPAAVVDMTYQDDVLQASLPYDQLSQADQLQYEVEISDGVNSAVSARQTVTVGSSESVDTSLAPALTITEIIPDTSNVNDADAYEFIEIYNNSNQDIDLKDYKLYYNYPDNGDDSDVVWWETSESKILKSGETLVFWVKNGSNDSLTIDDFNTKFGTNLTADQLIEISSGGMSNSGARGVKIASNVKDVLDYVTYNMNGTDNTNTDKSITYQNGYSDGEFVSTMVSDNSAPTPGTVTDSEKPRYQAELPDRVAEPALTDNTPSSFNSEESLTFELEAVSAETTIKTVRLYVKDNNSDSYETYNLLRESGDVFTKELPSVDLYGKAWYEYYFEVSDGYQTVETDVKRVENENPPAEGDSLNVSDGQFLSGTTAIIGTGSDLKIDGEDVTQETVPSINGDALIAFDASQTDVFFKNAVAIGDDVLGVFNEGTYDEWATYSYAVDAHYFDSETKEITIAFHAGNKANNLEHDIENNDDFVLKNIRLILPDGVSLRPESYGAVNGIGAVEHTEDNWHPDEPYDMGAVSPEEEISMGDGTSKVEILYVTFQLEESSFNALRYDLDTTSLEDGTHTITSGECAADVIVDNTAPVITASLEDGKTYRNAEITAEATDALSSEVELTVLLDGEAIELPYTLNHLEMEPGEHTLNLTAVDQAGNTAEETIVFYTPEENAAVEGELSPADGTTVNGDPTFAVTATDPTGDDMTVTFKQGERYELGDEAVTETEGVSNTSGTNGQNFDQESGDGFPWQQFDIEVGEQADENGTIRINWEGTSNNEKTFLYVYNTASGSWDQADAEQTTDGDTMTLTADVALADYLDGSVVHVMVQNGEGYTPEQYAEGEASENATYNENDTPREDYDFTFVVESDTQYYNEDYDGNPSQDVDGQYQYQLDIHNWIINNRERMNIQYMFHDGDIIDDEPLIPEWENADAAYQLLDDAGIPYGVLAGNHDVGHLSGDYTNFSKYFGEARYSGNPWYGGSYQDNRGHYDLITVDGIDFIMVYMGWGIGDEEINWMNDVLAQYPERKAILNFHEYLLASGGLGEEPQRVYDEVVATNPNVCMVLSGHYHNAQTRIDSFDDDGDGVADRNVYQLLFDYQGLSEGGMGYIRLMHFDLENERIIFRTYSPSLDDYDAKDETDIGDVAGINGEEEFTISFADLGIEPETKTLETTGLTVDLYGSGVIGTVENVESGTTAKYTWTGAPEGTFGWYAEITDANGGLTRTDVNYVTIEKTGYEPVITLPDSSDNAVQEGAEFDPMDGVTAVDYQGNDITDRVTVTGSVNTSVPGTYELTYDVTDEAGNTATAVRIIRVLGEDSGNDNPGGGDNEPGGDNPGGGTGTGNNKPGSGTGTGTGGGTNTGAGGGNGTNSGKKPSGGQQTGNSPATGDVRGAWTPAYVSAILAGFAGLTALLKKRAVRRSDREK